ncbi:unnamed protein product [Boreogadus saida]
MQSAKTLGDNVCDALFTLPGNPLRRGTPAAPLPICLVKSECGPAALNRASQEALPTERWIGLLLGQSRRRRPPFEGSVVSGTAVRQGDETTGRSHILRAPWCPPAPRWDLAGQNESKRTGKS